MGWNSERHRPGRIAVPRNAEVLCGIFAKGKKKMFYEQSVIRNSKHALSSGLTVLAGRPVPVQTAPAEKPGNPGKVRTALLNLEDFFFYQRTANVCPHLTF